MERQIYISTWTGGCVWRGSACAAIRLPPPRLYIYHHPGRVETSSTPPRPGAPPARPPTESPAPPRAPREEHRPGGGNGHVTTTGCRSPVPWATSHAASTAAPRPGARSGTRHPKPRPPACPRVPHEDRPLAHTANWPTSHAPRARRAPFPFTTRSPAPASPPTPPSAPTGAPGPPRTPPAASPRPPMGRDGPPGGRHPGTGAPRPACGAGLRERSLEAPGEATPGVTLPGPPP